MYELMLRGGDVLFGWMLYLPNDLLFLCLALMTSLFLIASRKLATDQDRLMRCKADKQRLKELIREAKARNDKDAIARHRATQNAVGLIQARAEWKPLLVALLPLALVATWAYERVAYHPSQSGETIAVTLSLPVSESGKLVHLTPADGLTCSDGWMRRVEKKQDDRYLVTSEWKIQADRPGLYPLKFRYGGKTFEQPLLVGEKKYEHPSSVFNGTGDQTISTVALRPRMLLGVVPGVRELGIEPWMAAYLILTIPVFLLNKMIFKVA